EVFPVDAQMIAFAPRSSALDTAKVMPRSLNEPVGLTPSFLTKTSQSRPTTLLNCGQKFSGVFPSPKETIGVEAEIGRNWRYCSITPLLHCDFAVAESI